jgi:hypothetical protein
MIRGLLSAALMIVVPYSIKYLYYLKGKVNGKVG